MTETEAVKTERADSREELAEALRVQTAVMEKQLSCMKIFSAIMVLAMITMAVFVGIIFAKTTILVNKSEAVAEQAKEVTEQLDGEEIQSVVENINGIMQAAQQSADGLASVDFGTLNSAVQELYRVVEPVAKALEELE